MLAFVVPAQAESGAGAPRLIYIHLERPTSPHLHSSIDRTGRRPRPYFVVTLDGQLGIDRLERDDSVTVQYFRGRRRVLAPQECRLNTVRNRFHCRHDNKRRFYKAGDYEARITFKEGESGKVYRDLARLRFKVVRYIRYYRANGRHDWAFAIDRDHHVGEAWMYELPPRSKSDQISAWFYVWFKVRDDDPVNRLIMRCYKDGRKVATLDAKSVYTIEHKVHSRRGSEKIVYVLARFLESRGRWAAEPPKGKQGRPSTYYYSKHPGEHICKISSKGDLVREIRFEVRRKNGLIRQPLCIMKKGPDHLGASKYYWLLQTKVTGSFDLKHDRRAYMRRGFWGLVDVRDCTRYR
jgi:hypothetical protein